MPELADIFRSFGADYLARYSDSMLPSHRRAMEDITACRTEILGGHVFRCDNCGAEHYAYHSCKNRHCPKCSGREAKNWLKKREDEILPTIYFHLVFTLPEALRPMVRKHQKALFSILMKAAARSLMELAKDPKYVGGRIAILAVLHTWTRAMVFHPHVHCLVPGGALSFDGTRWIPSRDSFFVPVKALSILFRATFMELARSALPNVRFPESLWHDQWVVYSKRTVQGSERVLQYLGRYVHRVAITITRILSVDDENVTFRYKDSKERCWKQMTLSAIEFLRRFLQHVLPEGFHKVRLYGIIAPGNRHLLKKARLLVGKDQTEEPKVNNVTGADEISVPDHRTCPQCKKGRLVLIAILYKPIRAPP
jgi:hypothetical protein